MEVATGKGAGSPQERYRPAPPAHRASSNPRLRGAAAARPRGEPGSAAPGGDTRGHGRLRGRQPAPAQHGGRGRRGGLCQSGRASQSDCETVRRGGICLSVREPRGVRPGQGARPRRDMSGGAPPFREVMQAAGISRSPRPVPVATGGLCRGRARRPSRWGHQCCRRCGGWWWEAAAGVANAASPVPVCAEVMAATGEGPPWGSSPQRGTVRAPSGCPGPQSDRLLRKADPSSRGAREGGQPPPQHSPGGFSST